MSATTRSVRVNPSRKAPARSNDGAGKAQLPPRQVDRPHRRKQAPDESVEFQEIEPLVFWVPKFRKHFDYTDLFAAFGQGKARRIGREHMAFVTRYAQKTAIGYRLALTHFARTLAAKNHIARRLARARGLRSGPGAAGWLQGLREHEKVLREMPRTLRAYAAEYNSLCIGLEMLRDAGLAPSFDRQALPKHYNISGGRRPSLLEQSAKASDTAIAHDLVEAMQAQIERLGIEVDGREIHDLLHALAKEVPVETLHDELAVAEAMLSKNAQTLTTLREIAERAFIEWRDVWEEGQRLLSNAPPGLAAAVKDAIDYRGEDRSIRARRFVPTDDPELTKRNLLAYFAKYHSAEVPSEIETTWTLPMRKAYRQAGGRPVLDACFCLHRLGVAAAAILYMIDSGANVSTTLSLTVNSEQSGQAREFANTVSYKDRAGPDPLVRDLPVSDDSVQVTAVQALRGVVKMTATRRELYSQVGDALFIFQYHRDEPSVADDRFLRRCMRYMLRNANLPAVWTPSAIRIAFAIEHSGRSSGDMTRLGQVLGHAEDSDSTPGYGMRLPVKLLCVRRIRQFTTLYEVAYASHTERGPLILGYSEKVGQHLLGEAHRTGLGFMCRNIEHRGGKLTDSGPECPDVGPGCPGCAVHLYVVDEQSLGETICVQAALDKRLDVLETAKQKQWKEEWLDLYAFSTAVLQKVKSSQYAYLLPRARRVAEQLSTAGFDPLLLSL